MGLYTVEGRQRGDLRQEYGSVLIRKAKNPLRDWVKGRPFIKRGPPTRRIDAARELAMRRILLVGDDRRTRLAIGIWLKQCGLRVAITDGGESGLAALHDGMFDQMIVDVFMPNMRAFEPIRVFHSRAPTVPLIAISGYAFSAPGTDDPTCFKRALSLGATRCLRKGNHWHLSHIR